MQDDDTNSSQITLNVTSGNQVVVFGTGWTLSGIQPVITLSDDQGNSYSVVVSETGQLSHIFKMWRATLTSGGTTIFTLSSDQPDTWIALCVVEIESIDSVAGLATNTGASQTPTSGAINASGSAQWIYFAAVSHDTVGRVIDVMTLVSSGWSLLHEVENTILGLPMSVGFKISNNNSETADWTFTTTEDWVVIAAAFNE